MAVKSFEVLEEVAGASSESVVSAAAAVMRAGAAGDGLRNVVIARSLNALAEVVGGDIRGLEEVAAASSDVEVLLRVLERPEALEAVGDPLFGARLRGVRARRALLESEGGAVSAAEMGAMLGITAQAVNKRRKAGRLLGLPAGRNRFRYPVWQVEDGEVVAGFEETLDALGVESPWMRAAFFLGGNARLGGGRPLDGIQAGNLEAVKEAARARGTQLAE